MSWSCPPFLPFFTGSDVSYECLESFVADCFSQIVSRRAEMYCGSGTVDSIASGLHMHQCLLCVHSSDGSTFLREMTSWLPFWKFDIKSKIWLCQIMHIYPKNISVTFHPDPVWNDGSLGFCPDKKNMNNNKMSSDIWSVHDPNIICLTADCAIKHTAWWICGWISWLVYQCMLAWSVFGANFEY